MTDKTNGNRLQLWGLAKDGFVKGFYVICARHQAEKELLLVNRMDARWVIPLLGLELVRVTRPDMLAALEDDEKHARTGCCLCAGSNTRTRLLPGHNDITTEYLQHEVRRA